MLTPGEQGEMLSPGEKEKSFQSIVLGDTSSLTGLGVTTAAGTQGVASGDVTVEKQ